MAEDAFVTDFEHIMADDITENVRFIMYDSASGKTASASEVRKYMMKNVHVDTTLTEEGAAAEAKAVGEALATKADTKGRYEDLIVGGAEQLMADEYETDKEPYLFRTTGGSADVGNREYLDKIVGGTVAWNQLVSASATSVTVQSSHKYIANIGGAWSVAASSGSAISVTGGTDILIDLTALFNPTIADYIYSLEQATAGAGVAWFKKLFPKDYYPYDPGTLRSVEGVSAHETVGFNQWDEEWETGHISSSDGSWVSAQYAIRSKNYIPVFPDTTYYITTSSEVNIWGYDENHNAVRRLKWGTSGTFNTTGDSPIRYIRFGTTGSAYGATYKNDICINLSWDGERDGEYEEYVKHSYPLDNSLTLRGIPKLADGKLAFDGDVYPPSGEVQRRYGVVDLGTLDWSYASNFNRFISGTLKGVIVSATSDNGDSNVGAICSHYVRAGSYIATAQPQNNKSFGIGDNGTITVRDESYTDAASFKTAMSGVYLVYELATPTTETAEGYEQYQICDPSGTEEFVTTGIVPVGHETRYPHDLKKKIETAPDSPSTDGTYLMKRSGGKNAYMALPSTPSANGSYVLTVTVSGGSASYSWTAKE